MNVGFRGVLAPENDQAGVFDIPRCVVFVLTESEARGLEPGRPAEIAVGRRAPAVEPPERHADAVEQAFGPAARVI